jgi:hypothetical protein
LKPHGPSPYVAAGLAVALVLVLLQVTLRSASTPLGSAREDRVAATREYRRAVREPVGDARFPFEANVVEIPGGRLQLAGSMDSGSGLDTEHRNYVCFLSPQASPAAYVADSVEVWKSH